MPSCHFAGSLPAALLYKVLESGEVFWGAPAKKSLFHRDLFEQRRPSGPARPAAAGGRWTAMGRPAAALPAARARRVAPRLADLSVGRLARVCWEAAGGGRPASGGGAEASTSPPRAFLIAEHLNYPPEFFEFCCGWDAFTVSIPSSLWMIHYTEEVW